MLVLPVLAPIPRLPLSSGPDSGVSSRLPSTPLRGRKRPALTCPCAQPLHCVPGPQSEPAGDRPDPRRLQFAPLGGWHAGTSARYGAQVPLRAWAAALLHRHSTRAVMPNPAPFTAPASQDPRVRVPAASSLPSLPLQRPGGSGHNSALWRGLWWHPSRQPPALRRELEDQARGRETRRVKKMSGLGTPRRWCNGELHRGNVPQPGRGDSNAR